MKPRWFARAGRPLDAGEKFAIDALRGALDIGAEPGGPLAVEVIGWQDLGRILRDEDRDNRWWDAEEGERERLWSIASERMTEGALSTALTESAAGMTAAVCSAAMRATSDAFTTGDMSLARAASDAVLLAVHQHLLASIAEAGDAHYFAIKYRLFAAGRWPLGPSAGRFVIL